LSHLELELLITEQGSDLSGLRKWSYMDLEGKTIKENNRTINQKINFTTAHCFPQQDSATPGHETAFMQQKRMLALYEAMTILSPGLNSFTTFPNKYKIGMLQMQR
jgi:hypothetical protein